LKIIAENLTKHFNRNYLFESLNFEVSAGEALAVLGANGSGKTTLIKILCGLKRASSGKIIYRKGDKILPTEDIYSHIGLVSPYLEFYEELTARENLDFFADMKNIDRRAREKTEELCEKFRLTDKMDVRLKTYSSGMKQRLKYAAALMGGPAALFVDEPRTNLDEKGINTVYELLSEYKKGGALIIATNEKQDLWLADKRLTLNE
jgi:heme exporter protein A